MSATKGQRESAKAIRDEWDRRAAARGHQMVWRLGENARRRGYVYFFVGRCQRCGAEMTCDWSSTSCPGVRDARTTPCSGPGTAILTEIEAQRVSELVTGALIDFHRAIHHIQVIQGDNDDR